jgi:Polysaccharide pyruvyl transferase
MTTSCGASHPCAGSPIEQRSSPMPPVRIGLITTLNRNIGDDFIRDGIVQLMLQVFAGRDVRFVTVNKHTPWSVYPGWHPLRWLQTLEEVPRGRRAADWMRTNVSGALHPLGGSRFDHVDIVVQCGAPVLWPGCHGSEWASPLWDQVVGRLSDRVPVLNLAAGSAYAWEDQPKQVSDARDVDFLRRIMSYCRVTTARDELASRLAGGLGVSVPTIPCSAFLVGRRFGEPSRADDGIVLFNYMSGAGHFGWQQGIDETVWMETARSLVKRLSTRHRLAFICHDVKEYAAAERVNPDLPRFLPRTPEEYFSLIRASKAAVCNRLHAAVALASVGIPSVSVGTDTRLLMVAAIGLPHRYVKDVDVALLEEALETLVEHRNDERDRLLELREWTWSRYVDEATRVVAP